jgi:hypothetical protein
MTDAAPALNVKMDLTGWLGDLQRELDALIADLVQVCTAVQQRAYASNLADFQYGVARIMLEVSDGLRDAAPERAARGCFLNGIGKFISFLDKLIATQRVAKQGIPVERDIADPEDLKNYVQEYIATAIAKVAQDRSLTNPKKMQCFAGISADVNEAALQLFELRRTFEHYQDVPQKEFVVPSRRIGIFVDGVEITQIPWTVKAGQALSAGVVIEEKIYPAGVKIALSPKDASELVFMMRTFLAPEVFRAHVEAGGPLQQAAARECT